MTGLKSLTKAVPEPGLSQTLTQCTHPQNGSEPFPHHVRTRAFTLHTPHFLRVNLRVPGSGQKHGRVALVLPPCLVCGRWRSSWHLLLGGYPGQLRLEGSHVHWRMDTPALPPSLPEALLPGSLGWEDGQTPYGRRI